MYVCLKTRILIPFVIISAMSCLSAAEDYTFLTNFISTADIYPVREQLIKNAMALCKSVSKSEITNEEITTSVKNLIFKNPKFLNRTNDGDRAGWTADFNLGSSPLGFLRLIKAQSSFTFSFSQTESTIEAIAAARFDANCQDFNEARFTYYNNSGRPVRRVKVNSKFKETQSVIMEESVSANSNLDSGLKLRIGIIDSGVDYNHKVLISKTRPMLGIDLTNPERPPYDYTNTYQNEMMGRHFTHGTAVADIASRNADVLIIPARTENKSYLDGAAAEFLATKNVRIINISQGGTKESDWLSLKKAIQNHPEILFIVSSGNDSADLNTEIEYPSTFTLDNLIVIASVDSDGKLSSFSNYGAKHVHFAALGDHVQGAAAGGGYWTVSGTSFAAPLVTNIAAKMLIENPNLTIQELKMALIKKAKPLPNLKDKVLYGVLGFE